MTTTAKLRKLSEQRDRYLSSRTWPASLREHAAELRAMARLETQRGHHASAQVLLATAGRAEREADEWEAQS